MMNADDRARQQPRAAVDASDVLASAVTLVGLARAPGRPRLALGARLACVPFLFRTGPRAEQPGAAPEGSPLMWALLPLASLFPFMAAFNGEAGHESLRAPPEPVTAAVMPEPTRRPNDPEDRSLSLGPLPLRAGVAHTGGLPRPPVLALRQADAPLAAARRAGEPTPVPPLTSPSPAPLTSAAVAPLTSAAAAPLTPRSPFGASSPEHHGTQPLGAAAGAQRGEMAQLPALTAPPRPNPPAAPRAAEYTWNLPLVGRRQPAAAIPGPAPALRPRTAQDLPELPTPTSRPDLAPGPPRALPFARPQVEDSLPPLRPRSPARGMDLTEVVQNLRTVIEQTVVEEVRRSAAKLAPMTSAPRPAEVLAEIYTDHSIRKLLARMRRVEQEERHRGGAL